MDEAQWLGSSDPQAMLEFLRFGAINLQGFHGVGARKLWLFIAAVEREWWGGSLRGEAPDPHNEESLRLLEALAEGHVVAGSPLARRIVLSFSLPDLADPGACARECVRIHNSKGDPPRWANYLRCVVGNPFRPVTLATRIVCDHCGRENPTVQGGTFACLGCGQGRAVCRQPWLTPTVVSLAQAAYEERSLGWPCDNCGGLGTVGYDPAEWAPECGLPLREEIPAGTLCPDCRGTGRVGVGFLDPVRLLVLADALEEAGCPVEPRGILEHLRSEDQHVRGCWAVDLLLEKE